jgi:alpha-glucosidase
MIYDKDEQVYQVPEFVVPRPSGTFSSAASQLDVSIEEEPFSFTVTRTSNGEEIFSTKGSKLNFETQYWRLRTSLPDNPNLYGLGEHTDSLRLPTTGKKLPVQSIYYRSKLASLRCPTRGIL